MATYVPPKKNTEYIFYMGLPSQMDGTTFQVNPTLATGDVKVSTDGGTLGNLTTLPVVTPAGSKMIKVTVSATEMNGDNVTLIFSDAAGAEWCDVIVNLQTAPAQIGDLATAANLTTDIIADSIPADGTRPSITQALLMVTRFLMEKSVSSTTVTINKEDGSTPSMTLTLDSATTPTSISRTA
jgi:hypothetical protein